MRESELAIKRVPAGECPFCKNKQFFVSEIVKTDYLLNRDGQVIDSDETVYDAVGICLNCNHQYLMKPVFDGFIPLTPLRQFMYDYIELGNNEDSLKVSDIKNPMQKEG